MKVCLASSKHSSWQFMIFYKIFILCPRTEMNRVTDFDIVSVGSCHFYMFLIKKRFDSQLIKAEQAQMKCYDAFSPEESMKQLECGRLPLKLSENSICYKDNTVLPVSCSSVIPQCLCRALLKSIVNIYQLLWTILPSFWLLQSNVKRVSCDFFERYFLIINLFLCYT